MEEKALEDFSKATELGSVFATKNGGANESPCCHVQKKACQGNQQTERRTTVIVYGFCICVNYFNF